MKAQVALEYLLLAVAVFALVIGAAAVVLLVLEQPSAQRDIQMDILKCGNNHTWLKQYTQSYDGTPGTAPGSISYYDAPLVNTGSTGVYSVESEIVCILQNEYPLRLDTKARKAWLLNRNGEWLEYGVGGSGGVINIGASNQAAPSWESLCGSGSNDAAKLLATTDVFDLEFPLTGVDTSSVTTATLTIYQKQELLGSGSNTLSLIDAADFDNTIIPGNPQWPVPVTMGASQPVTIDVKSAVQGFAGTHIYFRVNGPDSLWTDYCGTEAINDAEKPNLHVEWS